MPTVVMNVFGVDGIPVDVSCEAHMSVPNVDIVMALDVTGSMRLTNTGDTLNRMDSLKQVIRDFHAKIEASKAPGSRTRYGFVPYASNVMSAAVAR